MSICGRGMLTRSLPFLPIISPRLMYLLRLLLTLPRTSLRKRCWSRSIFWPTAHPIFDFRFSIFDRPAFAADRENRKSKIGNRKSLLRVSPGEDAGHEGEHVRGALLVVAVVADQPALDDVDLLLGGLVHDVGHQAGQLDGVLLVLEQLQLQGLLQALVGLVVELLAVDGQGADVVHDLAAVVVLAALGDVDLLLDGAHQALVGLLVVAGVAVADLLALR